MRRNEARAALAALLACSLLAAAAAGAATGGGVPVAGAAPDVPAGPYAGGDTSGATIKEDPHADPAVVELQHDAFEHCYTQHPTYEHRKDNPCERGWAEERAGRPQGQQAGAPCTFAWGSQRARTSECRGVRCTTGSRAATAAPAA